jgi:hypothetical protein
MKTDDGVGQSIFKSLIKDTDGRRCSINPLISNYKKGNVRMFPFLF